MKHNNIKSGNEIDQCSILILVNFDDSSAGYQDNISELISEDHENAFVQELISTAQMLRMLIPI